MANTSLTVAAAPTIASEKMVAACSGALDKPGVSIKAFTATAGTGNFPLAGLTLNLSALFPNKVLAVVCSPLYDPAVTTGDLIFPVVYVAGTSGNPATGVLHAYSSNGAAPAGCLHLADDTTTITGYVVTGFAIGY